MRLFLATVLFLTGALLAGALPARAQAPGPVIVQTAGGSVSVVADRIEYLGADDLVVATGNVEIIRGTSRLSADRVEIDRATGDAVAQGGVRFYDGEDRLTGDRVEYNLKSGTGVVYQGRLEAAPYYRLAGERMERVGEHVYRVRRGVFTTCEEDEVPAWSLRFGDATVDLDEWLYGTNASFWVKRVPLVPFIPFFAAAIRHERQTGFLPLKVGSTTRKGFFTEIPFFWAISDSQDATVGLDLFERRGVGGSAEYRYVLSERQQGAVSGFFVYEALYGGDRRGWGRFQHDWRPRPGLGLRTDLNGVSDDRVLRLYEDSLQARAAQRADSNIFLTRSWENWNAVGRVYVYQDLTTPHPVELQRLPELSLQGLRQPLPGLPGVLYQVDASFVNFYRELGSDGMRLDLRPRLSRPLPLAGYATLTPFVGGRVTTYNRTVTDVGTSREGVVIEHTRRDERVRWLAEVGADAETRATRPYAWGETSAPARVLHSIEPRAHYVRIFGANFYGLPIWNERIDRVPEANWLEYSMTNRLRGRTLGPGGTETGRVDLVRLVVGHARDLENGRWGNLAGDLIVQPIDVLRFRSDMSYSIERGAVEAFTTDVEVRAPRVSVTAGTRYDRRQAFVPEFVELPGTYNPGGEIPDRASVNFLQGRVSAEVWRRLTARVTTNWDLRSDTFVENRFGLDIKFQCWGLLVEYVRRDQGSGNPSGENELRFAVNLLGVGTALSTRVGVGDTGTNLRLK